LWRRHDFIERLLFAGTGLDQARAVFADLTMPGVALRRG
jgi:hypothetical protein